MNYNREQIFSYIYMFFITVLVLLGFIYEEPFGNRNATLIVISIAFFVISALQLFVRNIKFKIVLISISLILLATLEMNSKYAINYYYHSIYFADLFGVFLKYPKKPAMYLSFIISIFSTVKFIELLLIQATSANIALFVFFTIIQILIILVIIFAKNYWDENAITQELYCELLDTNKQLQLYSDEIRQLTMVEERTKIARDLHDTLGHDLTGLIMQMEITSRLFNNNQLVEGMDNLEKAKKSARASLSKVREILSTLKDEERTEWTHKSLYQLVEEFQKKTNIEIECIISGYSSLNPDMGVSLYRIVQEALTNSARHSKSEKILIQFIYKENEIAFNIVDNGNGNGVIIKGNGLKGMEERVALMGGEITFENNKGFRIKGFLPYKREDTND